MSVRKLQRKKESEIRKRGEERRDNSLLTGIRRVKRSSDERFRGVLETEKPKVRMEKFFKGGQETLIAKVGVEKRSKCVTVT